VTTISACWLKVAGDSCLPLAYAEVIEGERTGRVDMPSSNSNLNIDALQWRLAEVITWCTRHGSLRDAAEAAVMLRTQQLCPIGLVYAKGDYVVTEGSYTYFEPSLGRQQPEALKGIVEGVATRRAEELKLSHRYPVAPAQTLAGGRLLCYAPYENLAEGVEEASTDGYFDLEAVPPWDTWLWFCTEETPIFRPSSKQTFWNSNYLISWVPSELVDIVSQGGVATSSTDALAWADELDSALFRQLRVAGILAQGR
jgi:hypothetical protein